MAKKNSAKKGSEDGYDQIKKKVSEMKAELIVLNAAIVTLGLIMIIIPEQFNTFIGQILGCVLCVWGLLRCISFLRLKKEDMFGSFALVQGAALLGIGIYFLINSDSFLRLLNVILIIMILVTGVLKLQYAINYYRLRSDKWWVHLIGAAILITLGLIAIFKPGIETNKNGAAIILTILIGASFVFSGLWDIVSVMIMSKIVKNVAQEASKQSRYVSAEAEETPSDNKGKDENVRIKKISRASLKEERVHFSDDDDID